MESKSPEVIHTPDRVPGSQGQMIEAAPRGGSVEREVSHVEKVETRPIRGDTVAQSMPEVSQSVLPQVAVVPTVAADPSGGRSSPVVANDDDLIEKEWVDSAKKIISSTRDDPYRREIEIGRLQADYLKKRYGKDLRVTED